MKRADNPFKYMLWQFEPHVQDVTVQYDNYPSTTVPFLVFMKSLTSYKIITATLNLKEYFIYTISFKKKYADSMLHLFNTPDFSNNIQFYHYYDTPLLSVKDTHIFNDKDMIGFVRTAITFGNKVYITVFGDSRGKKFVINGYQIREGYNSFKFLSLEKANENLKMMAFLDKVDNK